MADGCSDSKCDPVWCDTLVCLKPSRGIELSCTFNLEDENPDLFECWAQEHTEATGTTIKWWVHDVAGSTIDPLYNEPSVRSWKGPYLLKVHLTWPEQSFEVREEGSRIVWPGQVWIPRLSVEQVNMEGFPSEGDVCHLWDIPFFDTFAQGTDANIPKAGYYFDVTGVVEDGHVLTKPDFTGFKCDLMRRTEFAPERRLFNET